MPDEPVLGLRERKKIDTRKALSDAAVELMYERGLKNLVREDIAARAGVSPRTFSNYFANKYGAGHGPAGRLPNLQGLGAGGLVVGALSIVSVMLTPQESAKVGTWTGLLMGISLIGGPLIGGVLTDP